MRTTIRSLVAIALAAVAASPAVAATPLAAPSTVPAADFFSFASMTDAVLSPDASAVAVLVRNVAGRRQLAVIDTADLKKVRIVASFDEYDIDWAQWADDKSLVFGLGDETESAADYRGSGLYGIGRDGEGLRRLINFSGFNSETGTMIKSRTLDAVYYSFMQTLHDGSGDVVIGHLTADVKINAYGSNWTGMAPLRMNVRTGTVTEMGKGWPSHVFEWVIDAQGQVRAGLQRQDGQKTLFVADGAGVWKPAAHFSAYQASGDAFSLVGVAADSQAYVGKATGEGGGEGLFRFDLATGRADAQPIVSARGFDVEPELVEDFRAHKLLGVHYEADAAGTVWFDPAMKALQAKVDARLPGLVNQIDPADCGCAKRVLVRSHSDRQPTLLFLYDRDDDLLIPMGSARPNIDARQMADTDFVRIKARDGASLPVYVTKPHGKGPWPTVVLVHGGPFLRGWQWRWDPESQFLASRGYLVVKPEFRGSAGYGSTLREAGNRQWGLKMQDDIADATTWAARQGLADAKRTCIAGASYGGYATLMGLVRYPDLYRCGVAWAAVTDINLMYDIYWSDATDVGDDWKVWGMPQLIGDPVKDAEQLKATSPLEQAARIQRPLLLAHGGVDRRVPIAHATKLLSALEAAHAPVTWIEFRDEAHGWKKPATRISFYEQVQAFLDANIGAGAPAAKP